MDNTPVGEARVAYNGVPPPRMESRREYAHDSSSVIFEDKGQVLEALPVVS